MAEELGRFENPILVGDLLSSAAAVAVSFWTWNVVLVSAAALFAKLLLSKLQISARFHNRRVLLQIPTIEDDDGDETSVSSSDSDDETDEMKEEEGEDVEREDGSDASNFSSSPFLSGDTGVVRAWEGLGLGIDRSGGRLSLFDMSHDKILRSFGCAGNAAVVRMNSAAEILSAGGTVVKVWDTRTKDELPAAIAMPDLRRRVAGAAAREGKVFVDLRSL